MFESTSNMKFKLVLPIWLFVNVICIGTQCSTTTTWDAFKKEFQKSYSAEEEINRKEIFLENVKLVDRHNQATDNGTGPSYRLTINSFADMSEEEFKNSRTHHVTPKSSYKRSADLYLNLTEYSLPEVDWRKEGFVSPVKDQGPCGSGSVFAAVGALEGQERGIFSSLVPLSAQQLLDCCGKGSCSGCGANDLSPTDYLECTDDIDGLDSDRCYVYTGKCHQCRTFPKCISVGVRGYNSIQSGNEESLRQALAMIGPIAASLDASKSTFRFLDGRSIYSDPSCSSSQLNHQVLIVGYGTEGSTPYWLIKNSWGTGWGDKGYAKILRNKNQCGIAQQAVYPLVTVQKV